MAHYCESCERDFTNPKCPRCGGLPSAKAETPVVSVPDATLDTMIEQASRPTLASLLKRGVANGTITPSHEYSSGNVSS